MNKKRNRQPGEKGNKQAMLSISVCVIAKNEEKYIEQCLQSVKAIADEIILVDTGSTDRTVEIARKYTDRIYFHPWNDSFSEARNRYLKYASSEWIFQIDADEVLLEEDIPQVRRAVRRAKADAIRVQILSQLRGGRSEGVHCVERIFRNNGTIHYEGRVHNRLVGIRSAAVFPIRLLHYGYDLDPEASRKKFERTVSLLNRDLEDDPGNPMTYHYLGCSYLSRGLFQQSFEVSKKAIELASVRNDRDLLYLWSHYNASMSCYKLKDLAQAETLCLTALEKYPKHVDSHFVLSLVCFDQKQWEKVISHGREYLRLAELQERDPAAFGNLVMCSLKERWNVAALVGMAHAELGQERKAEETFQKAMEWAPEPFLVARAVGIFLYNKGLLHNARSYLGRAVEISDSDETVRRLLAETQRRIGQHEKAPSISCCMIVKNEEAFLKQCLDSVKDYVDEIIVVDTGSSDKTDEIARQYTEKVYFHLWEGSFSKARNQVLAYATGDWIFQIDGDEELISGSGEKLREAVRNAGEADAIHVNIISTYSNGAKRARHNFERLFRNNGVIHYEGIVHNRVEGARSIRTSTIEVMHYGYDVDEKKAHEKFLRTSDLLKKQIAETPGDPMPHHYLGVSYLSRGLNREAAEESEKAIELAERKGDEHPLYIWARHNAAMAHFRMGDLDKARDYSLDALRRYPDHLDSHYTLTMVAAERAEWKDVLSYGARFIELLDIFEKNPQRAGVVINSTMNEGPAIHLLMGHAWNALGESSKTEREYQLAASLSEHPWQVWWNAGSFHVDRTGDLELAEGYLHAALAEAPKQQEVWYMLAKLHHKKEAVEDEKRCLETLWELGSEDPIVLKRLTSLCLEAGEEDFATKILEKRIDLDPLNGEALCRLGRIHQESREIEKAIGFFQRALQTDQEHPDSWLHLGEISLGLGHHPEARGFFGRVLSLRAYELQALLYLGEIELKENKIIEFVKTCDKLLERLQLNRKRVVNGLPDIMALLEEIREAVKDDSHVASQVDKLLTLLAHRIKEFAERTKQGESQRAIESERPLNTALHS